MPSNYHNIIEINDWLNSVVAWEGIIIDSTDPINPIVSVDPALLTSSVTFYSTTTASSIWGYNKLVTSIESVDYDEPAVNVSTGAITWADQLVGQLVTDPWLFVGNPWIITITTIGEIRKTSGGSHNAQFYFKVFHRTSGGTETEIAVSNPTLPINNASYAQFNTSALLNNGAFDITDSVVIKYYATKVTGGGDPVYEFLFGWTNPVRTLFPVPVDIIAIAGWLDTQVQFNDWGVLWGNANMTFNKTTGVMSLWKDALVQGATIGRGGGNIASNIAFWFDALKSNTTGTKSVAIGIDALKSNTTGNENVAIGNGSLDTNTTGNYNLAIWPICLKSNTTGTLNVWIGGAALYYNTAGNNNVAIGEEVLAYDDWGDGNVGIGGGSLSQTSWDYNVSLGYLSGLFNTTGGYNVINGMSALYNNSTGSYNIAIGMNAGRYIANKSTGATIVNNSILIWYRTSPLANNGTNEVVIGYDADGNWSNTVTIGWTGTTGNYFKGILDTEGNTLRVRTSRTPASATATGNAGDICWDADYIYVCTATNKWKRTAITTW